MGPRFSDALAFANTVHSGQPRKGTSIPYVAHLLGVASLVLEAGGDEDTAIAGLLHDAVEDQGGAPMLKQIRDRFGTRVADIVQACTDSAAVPKPPWRERKEGYLQTIAHKSPDALLVSVADKLHNSRAILADYKQQGEGVWERFHGGREGALWYYRALVEAFRGHAPLRLWQALEETVSELESLAARR